ncbi:nucleoside diphosphate kinase [Ceratobasidium sp. AG-Ba]|nr:nucleoside diphosphate kinase [Ceratobasidium sp. AG-Ba]
MSQSPEHASLSPVAFDRDGFRLSVEPEPHRSMSRSPIPPPKTPTPPHSQVNISVVEPPRSSLAVLIIKPGATKHRLKIEKRIGEAGFEIEKASGIFTDERKMGFHIESPGVVEMFGADAPSLSGDPVWVYVLSRARASSALSALAGPVDPLAARKTDPDSLRALYGSNRWENGVWVTRDEANAERVIGELFAGSPIMDFSDLPSVNGSPDRRKVRKASSHASSIRSEFTNGSRAKVVTPSVSSASLKVPTPTKTSTAASPTQAARAGFKARPIPSTIAAPSIVPRTTRAADLRAGGAAAAAAAAPAPRQRQSEEERERTFEGVPGHKRRESISVASTAPPTIAPRVNRSAQLRAQKLAEAADPSVKASRRQSMIDFPTHKERQLSPEVIQEKNKVIFDGVPGHKRRESIAVASTAPPTVAPRVNRSSMLRAQKLAAAAAGGSGGPPSSFKGAPAAEDSPSGGPARSLSARSSRTSIGGAPSGSIGRASMSGARPALKTSVSKTGVNGDEKPNGGALTPISNDAMTPRSKPTPVVASKPDIVPRTNKSALLRAAAKLKSAAVGSAGSVGKGSAGRKSLAI